MSGGVRNLRAMFENKDASNSPPDRGRSPAGSAGPGSDGTSPRPLSKVRTSFVAVERSGQLGNQMGLKRENSGEPSMARRRTSFSIDAEDHPKATAERKQSIASEFELRKSSTVIEETIPEVAVETPSIEVDKQLRGDTKLKKTAAGNVALNGHTNGSSTNVTTGKTVDKPPSSKFTGRPAPISTTKTTAPPKPSPKTIKSPPAPKTPKTPTTPRGRPTESSKQPEKKTKIKENKPPSTHTTQSTTKPTPSTAYSAASKTRIPPSPPQTGFVKPKPRSPTRPLKLPASLTAHTASSGSKTAATGPPALSVRRSLSRASENSQAANPLLMNPSLSRSPSRVSATTALKSLTRKPSTLNKTHSRPSLGPPPAKLKKQPSRQSLPPGPADEGFLARMMRPTTSSASKTAEKTPPKRAQSVKRPTTSDGPPKREAPKDAAPKMGKLIAKPVAKQKMPVTSPESKEEAKSEPIQQSKPEIPLLTATSAAIAHGTDTKANVPKLTEAENAVINKTEVANGPPSAVAPPAVLQKISEAESTPEKPAPVEEVVSTALKSAENEDAPAVIEKPVFSRVMEEGPEKTDDVEALQEPLELPKEIPEPIAAKAVETEVPKAVEATEDPEDVKAREEIAKLNAEFLKASAEDDVE